MQITFGANYIWCKLHLVQITFSANYIWCQLHFLIGVNYISKLVQITFGGANYIWWCKLHLVVQINKIIFLNCCKLHFVQITFGANYIWCQLHFLIGVNYISKLVQIAFGANYIW